MSFPKVKKCSLFMLLLLLRPPLFATLSAAHMPSQADAVGSALEHGHRNPSCGKGKISQARYPVVSKHCKAFYSPSQKMQYNAKPYWTSRAFSEKKRLFTPI